MKITQFIHHNVRGDGRLQNGGSVVTDGSLVKSVPEGGCGSYGCNCMPGHWISKVLPITPDGAVFGFKATFDSRAELEASDIGEIERQARLAGN